MTDRDARADHFVDDEGTLQVDLMFIIDVSGSVAKDFPNERKFAEDLVSSVGEDDYKGRINVAAVKFTKIANLAFPFNINRTRTEVGSLRRPYRICNSLILTTSC